MIDVRTEQLLPARDLPEYLASRGYGKKISPRMVRRWIEHGSDGARLEAVRIGGMWMTSIEAVQRWVVAQNHPAPTRPRFTETDVARTTRPNHDLASDARTAAILTEHRLAPTEVDQVIDSLVDLPESTRAHVAGKLFRYQIRRLADLRGWTLEELLAIRGLGARSAPVVRALWERSGKMSSAS